LLFCFGPSAVAQVQGYVWTKGNPASIKEKFFKGPGYRMLSREEEKEQMDEEGYLPPRKRAALFSKLKLEEALKGMDELDKDMLVMSARFLSSERLKARYPKLSKDQLSGLRRELAGK
jgi:hypothetical protein